MVLNSKQTTVAYRCPDCGTGVMSVVGLFALSADMVKLRCPCKKSEIQVIYNKESEQVRMTVPCIFCDKPHTFNINSPMFFTKDIFVLPCPYTDINIGFVGEQNNVKAELARTELELLDMLEQNGIKDFRELHGDDDGEILSDPQILDVVMFVIRDLDAEGKIYCRCHPNGREPLPDGCEQEREDCNYDVEMTEDGLRVVCRDCGAGALIPTDSLLSAHAFLNCDCLKLE